MSRILVIFGIGFAALILWVGISYWKNFYGSESVASPSAKSNLIRVGIPRPDDIVQSPLAAEGEARGNWFFEADFPVRVFDEDGTELGVGIARANGEWMTPDFVPFSAAVQFRAPKGGRGTVVFQKNNPSDLREHDDALRIPVRFR